MPRFKVKKPEVKMEEDCRYTVITEEVVSNKSNELEDKVEKSGLSISRNTNDPETSMQSRSMDQVLSKMDKGRKIIEGKQSIDLGSETKSSLKSMEIDGENKSAEITNICEENSRMKTEEGNNIDRHRSADNITAEADAIFRKAIKDMQFDRGANECSNTDGNSLEINRDKNSIEDVGAIINIGTNIEAPPRRAKLQSYREKDTKLSEDLITDQNTAKKKYEIDNVIFNDLSKEVVESQCSTRSNFFVSREDGDRSELGEKFLDHPYSRRWSSLENLRKTEVCEQYPKLQTSKASSTERKVKEKRTIGSLKTSLEKKMESVERKLEDRIERIWEVNVEKHPWLLPIESWIVDRCKSSGTYTVPHDKCSIPLEGEEAREKERRRSRFVEQSLEFKFTAAEKEDEEAKIESRVVEHLKKLRKTGSPKAERSVFDTANLISRLKRTENCSETTEDKNQPIGEVEGVLEMKDVKPHNYDLFDKLKDNVKGKMEDIHRGVPEYGSIISLLNSR